MIEPADLVHLSCCGFAIRRRLAHDRVRSSDTGHDGAPRGVVEIDELAAIRVVLLDLRDDPVEFAGGDVRAAVLARAGLRDLERGAAVAARGDGEWLGFAVRGADQRPVLAVGAVAMRRAAHVVAARLTDHGVLAGGPDPDRDRAEVAIARDLGEHRTRDAHVGEHVAQALSLVGLDPVVEVVVEPVGHQAADRPEVVVRPGQVLVISIDDLQWADADSVAMLTALLRPPGAPRLVLLIAERSDASAGFAPPCATRWVDVGPLATADAAALAATLLPAESLETSAAIAAEAHGHPLFVMELARAWRRHDGRVVTQLEHALASRIQQLGADARAVIEVVGVAGVPVAQAVVGEVAGVALGPLAAVLIHLRDDHLVRTDGLGTEDLVDAYHHRVRAAVVQQLDGGRARSLHARLAAALERRPEIDSERLFGHWLEAGHRVRARRYAIEAAEAAAAALAFDRCGGATPSSPRRAHREQAGAACFIRRCASSATTSSCRIGTSRR